MKKVYGIILLAALLFSGNANAQCGQRYHDFIFADSVVSNIKYGYNTKYNGGVDSLKLDIYFPKSDTQTNRPLFIIAHGGNFLGGSKTGTDVVPFAKDFAKMGYVTSSINYRTGMTNFPFPGPDSTDAAESVMRAVHDAKAAVRFFRKSFENGNPYGIDTAQIYFTGVSAGGFMALHIAYLDEISEYPSYIDTVGQQGLTGGMEGNSGNAGYSSNVAGVINMCGAVGDTAWIKAGDEPMMLFHGTDDNTVPYGSDMIYLLGSYPLLQVDGSYSINARANQMGIEHCFEIYEGQDHTPAVNNAYYYDTTLNITRNFLAHFVCNETLNCSYGPTIIGVEEITNENPLFVFPNPAASQVEINLGNIGDNATVSMMDINGKMVFNRTTPNNKVILYRGDLPSGLYFIRVVSEGNVRTVRVVFE